MASWQFFLSELELDILYRAVIWIQKADTLLWLDTVGSNTIQLEDDLSEMMVLPVDKGCGMNDDDDKNSDLVCICQQGLKMWMP